MIEDVQSGERFPTKVLPVSVRDIQRLGPGWTFDWRAELERGEVLKLVAVQNPAIIHGLMAVRRHVGFVEISLLENSPLNVGRQKRFKGIARSLITFAAGLSFRLGNEGYLRLKAKTKLIDHYTREYGFTRLGTSHLLILETVNALRLLASVDEGRRNGNGS